MIFPWSKPQSRSRRRPAARSRPSSHRKPASRRRPDPRDLVEGLEQRHYDVIGLALVAFGVYLAFVLYMGWDGGRVGGWLATGLENAAGRVAYVVPIALVAWGGALISRPLLRAPSALNAGGILVIAGLLLAFAAETAGLGPERPVRHDFFEQRFMTEHGGAVGEALYWASTNLFQRLGAHILAVLMLLSGALLLTGTTVAGFIGATGSAVRRAGTGTREVARTVRAQRSPGAADPWGEGPGDEIAITRAAETEPFATEPITSELDDEAETVATCASRRTGRVVRPRTSMSRRRRACSRQRSRPEAAADLGTTPMGERRQRHGVTASDEIALPPAAHEGARARQGRPRARHARP